MYKNKIIYSLIPARSGSTRIKHKNLKLINGKPLISYSIHHSLKCKLIDKTYVSTDSYKYQDIALKYGAEVPFIRPKKYAKNLSSDFEVFNHFVSWLKKNNQVIPDIIVHLRPTSPIRILKETNEAIKLFSDNYNDFDSLRSVSKFNKQIEKIYSFKNDKQIINSTNFNLIKSEFDANLPSQLLPEYFIHNGNIDIIKTRTITKLKSISGKKIIGFVSKNTKRNFDIDNYEDLKKLKLYFL